MLRRPDLLLLVFLSLSGCHNHSVPTAIPNRVAANEVTVYRAYLQNSLTHSKHPQVMWYIETETWPYDDQSPCDKQLVDKGVRPAYLHALRDLGTARYLIPAFNIGFVRTFDSYSRTVNGKFPDGPFITQTFSRVAFSPDGEEAFFHVVWIRGPGVGQGGWDEDILADKQGSQWQFREVGCPAIID